MTRSRGIFGPHDDNADSPPESKPTQSGPAPPLYHWSPPSCNCLKLKNQKCAKLELISFYDWQDSLLIGKIVTTPNIGWPSESWNADLIDPRIGCLAKPKDVVRWMSNVGMENLRRKGDIGPGVLRHRPITGSTLNPNVVHPSCQPEKISQFQSHWYHH